MAKKNTNPFPIPVFSDPDRSSLIDALPRIDSIFNGFYQSQRVPGLVWGVVVDGNLIHTGGVGIRNVDTPDPVHSDTVFRIASMSKSFAAMALIRLRDEGKVVLDAPAADYIPELAKLSYPTRDSAPITVFQLLTMGGGFPQDDPWADRQLNVAPKTMSAWIRGGISFSNAPGVKFEYSNFGYGLVGRIVTNASGMPYQKYVKKHILDPLGMSSSTYDVREVDPTRLAMGYRHEGDSFAEEPLLEDGEFGAMGGLFTTISDFSRYMSFLLSAFPARDDEDNATPIRRSSAREMQTGWRLRDVQSLRFAPDQPAFTLSDAYGYGLACRVDSVLGYSVAHGGGLPGYGTFYRLLPECGIGMVAFANLTYAGPSAAVFDSLEVLAKNGSLKKRTVPPAPALLEAQKAITELYDHWDDETIRKITTGDDSFFLDEPLEKRREEFAKLRGSFGKCRSISTFEAENALRGKWTLHCKRGDIEAYITLAPTVPPLVQVLYLTGARHPNAALQQATKRITKLIARWDDELARATFTRPLKRKVLRPQFAAVRVQYGELYPGTVVESDGETSISTRLDGEKGTVVLKIGLDAKSGKVKEIGFSRPDDTAFVP